MLEAFVQGDPGQGWRSFGIYRADNQGTIDMAGMASEEGRTTKIDANGLLWSMRRSGGKAARACRTSLRRCRLRLSAGQCAGCRRSRGLTPPEPESWAFPKAASWRCSTLPRSAVRLRLMYLKATCLHRPAAGMAEGMLQTPKRCGYRWEARQTHFPEAGHLIDIANLPVTAEHEVRAKAAAAAIREAWQTAPAFLQRNLA